MYRRFLMLMLACALLVSGQAVAEEQNGGQWFLSRVDAAVADGEITPEEGLLLKFQYVFDQERLPEEFRPQVVTPLKCATGFIAEFNAVRDELSRATVEAIDAYLAGPSGEGQRDVYISPSGEFRLTYFTSGGNAVPAADVNPANGVPDFVERCAEYLDFSWQTEIDEMGFAQPPEVSGYYQISFESMQAYGYTSISSGAGATRITLHNNFLGFSANDDPDGNQAGAAKVTCAHEFKHATQYVNSYWSEGGWVEVDATWAEEAVYPQTNDYHNYLPGDSPIKRPHLPLATGTNNNYGTGSYEDCVWQIWMSENFGWEIISDLWNYRRTHQSQWMMYSYRDVLLAYGLEFVDAWSDFTGWNMPSGYRAVTDFGYADAAAFPYGDLATTPVTGYPYSYDGQVDHLAANQILCLGLGDSAQRMNIVFNGHDAASFNFNVVVKRDDGTGYVQEIVLDENNDGVWTVPDQVGGLQYIGLVVGNPAYTSSANDRPYSIDLALTDANPVGETPTPFAMRGNYPNPFNPATKIAFALPAAGVAELAVFDLQGRRVRTVWHGELAAGGHELPWDGRNDAGQVVAAGTYLARLTSAQHSATIKMVLAK
jgi:hypothetical protein